MAVSAAGDLNEGVMSGFQLAQGLRDRKNAEQQQAFNNDLMTKSSRREDLAVDLQQKQFAENQRLNNASIAKLEQEIRQNDALSPVELAKAEAQLAEVKQRVAMGEFDLRGAQEGKKRNDKVYAAGQLTAVNDDFSNFIHSNRENPNPFASVAGAQQLNKLERAVSDFPAEFSDYIPAGAKNVKLTSTGGNNIKVTFTDAAGKPQTVDTNAEEIRGIVGSFRKGQSAADAVLARGVPMNAAEFAAAVRQEEALQGLSPVETVNLAAAIKPANGVTPGAIPMGVRDYTVNPSPVEESGFFKRLVESDEERADLVNMKKTEDLAMSSGELDGRLYATASKIARKTTNLETGRWPHLTAGRGTEQENIRDNIHKVMQSAIQDKNLLVELFNLPGPKGGHRISTPNPENLSNEDIEIITNGVANILMDEKKGETAFNYFSDGINQAEAKAIALGGDKLLTGGASDDSVWRRAQNKLINDPKALIRRRLGGEEEASLQTVISARKEQERIQNEEAIRQDNLRGNMRGLLNMSSEQHNADKAKVTDNYADVLYKGIR